MVGHWYWSSDMNRYVVIDFTGLATNIILWDGAASYDPGEGCSLVLEADYIPPETPSVPEE